MRAAVWCVAMAVVLPAACAQEPPYEKPLLPVRVRAVQPYVTGTTIRYSASVEPRTRVELAFKASGYIERLTTVSGRTIQDGDTVSRGMVLAQVRPLEYDEQLKQAQSRVAEAEAVVAQAKAALDRASRLFESRSLTRPELEQAQAAHDTAQAKLAGARAGVRAAESARDDTALKSPIDGVVLKRSVEVGSLVGPGASGFVLADTSSVKVVFGAPDTMLRTLKLGAVEAVSSEAVPNRTFSGRITTIAPAADTRSRVFDVEVTVPNTDGALKVGMVAVIQIGDRATAAEAPSLVGPLAAIVHAKGREGYAVYVVEDRDGKSVVRLRAVTVGPMIGNEISVIDGLRQGERVVVSGASIITDGDQVSLIL